MTNNSQMRIALSGKARVGKDTIAKLIIKHLNLNKDEYKIRAFAEPMKEIVKIMFPDAKNECLYGKSELRSEVISDKFIDFHGEPLTYRTVLTDIGSRAREYNKNIWIYNFDNDLKKSQDKKAYIASDLRYINEFSYLKENGFYLIRVLRKNTNSGNDVSETEQDQILNESFNYVIHNDFSIDILSEEVCKLVDRLPIK